MIGSAKTTPATSVARLETGERAAQKLAELFAEQFSPGAAVSFVDNGHGRWQVAIHFRDPPDEQAVRALAAAAAGAAGEEAAPALVFERIAAQDWVRDSLAGLAPVRAGRFVIHGAHHRAGIAPNRIGIEIEAALAFGTGHHGTTRGCLLALDWLCKTRSNKRRKRLLRLLDLGTGSGVLAIAAARALRQRVLATDIDANAVGVARGNARHNRAGPLLEIVQQNGAVGLFRRGPFDLVFANILLEPLRRLAAPLTRLTAPGGHVILSGLLAAQANAAIAAYRDLPLERRIDLDGWTTLVLKRRTRPHRAVARRRAGP